MSTELLEAVGTGNVARARQLLAAGADCNAGDGDGHTALMLAAYAGNLPMVSASSSANR